MTNLSLPTDISITNLQWWIQDNRARIAFLENLMARFEETYNCTLSELEARLERGEGQEHPDWEDSIEWRNVVEQHRQLPRFPHHFHTPDQQIVPSSLIGNPERDLELVRAVVESFLAKAES